MGKKSYFCTIVRPTAMGETYCGVHPNRGAPTEIGWKGYACRSVQRRGQMLHGICPLRFHFACDTLGYVDNMPYGMRVDALRHRWRSCTAWEELPCAMRGSTTRTVRDGFAERRTGERSVDGRVPCGCRMVWCSEFCVSLQRAVSVWRAAKCIVNQ